MVRRSNRTDPASVLIAAALILGAGSCGRLSGAPSSAPPSLAAADSVCKWAERSRAPLRLDGIGHVYLDLVETAVSSGTVLLAGTPTFEWDRVAGRDPMLVGANNFIGVKVRADGATEVIPSPRDMRNAVGLRVLAAGVDEWMFLWAEQAVGDFPLGERPIVALWEAKLAKDTWEYIREIKYERSQGLLSALNATAVQTNGTVHWVFPVTFPDSVWPTSIAVLEKQHEVWSSFEVAVGRFPNLAVVFDSMKVPHAVYAHLHWTPKNEFRFAISSRQLTRGALGSTFSWTNESKHISQVMPISLTEVFWLQGPGVVKSGIFDNSNEMDVVVHAEGVSEVYVLDSDNASRLWFALSNLSKEESVIRVFGESRSHNLFEIGTIPIDFPYHFRAFKTGDDIVVVGREGGSYPVTTLIRGRVICESRQ